MPEGAFRTEDEGEAEELCDSARSAQRLRPTVQSRLGPSART